MFQIQFSEEQLSYIINLLADKPFKEVHELIDGIRRQAQEQILAAQQAAQQQELQLPPDAEVSVEPIKKK
jgi:hypothetical protein